MSFASTRFIKTEQGSNFFFGIGCALLCATTWYLLFPGFVTSDSLGQLSEARGGRYSDWHPPLMSWLWRQLEHVVSGKPGMLALQLALLWSGIFLCVSVLARGLRLRFTLALTLFLFPPVLGWAGAITKDSLMLGAALVGAGLVLRIGDDRCSAQPALLCGIAAAFFVVCAVRHNGLFLVAGLALWAGVRRYPGNGMRSAVVTGLLLFLVPVTVAQLLNRVLTDTPTYPLASLLSFDVAGIAVRHTSDAGFNAQYQAAASLALLRPGHQLAELRRWHQPEDWLFLATVSKDRQGEPPVPTRWEAPRVQALKTLWHELVLRYPKDYFAHRFDASLTLLAWGDRSVRDPACFQDRGTVPGAKTDEPSHLQKVLSWRLDWLVQNPPWFRPWLYYALAWVLLGAALFLQPRNWQGVAGLLVSGLLHESALFFLSPAAEYRYSAWMMVATLLATFALMSGLKATRR